MLVRDSNPRHMDSTPSFGKVKNSQENIGDSNPQAQNALNAGHND